MTIVHTKERPPFDRVVVVYRGGTAVVENPGYDATDPRVLVHDAPTITDGIEATALAHMLLNEQTVPNPEGPTTTEREQQRPTVPPPTPPTPPDETTEEQREREMQERIDGTPPAVIPDPEPRR